MGRGIQSLRSGDVVKHRSNLAQICGNKLVYLCEKLDRPLNLAEVDLIPPESDYVQVEMGQTEDSLHYNESFHVARKIAYNQDTDQYLVKFLSFSNLKEWISPKYLSPIRYADPVKTFKPKHRIQVLVSGRMGSAGPLDGYMHHVWVRAMVLRESADGKRVLVKTIDWDEVRGDKTREFWVNKEDTRLD